MLSLMCYALLYVHFSFANNLKRKRERVACLLFSYSCQYYVTLPLPISLQCVIQVFLDHTHLLFPDIYIYYIRVKPCVSF